MRVSTSSVLLAALASSTSLSSFVTAAPTQGTDNSMSTTSEAPPPPEAPDLSQVLGSSLPTSSTRRDITHSQSLDSRGLFESLGALSPIVAKVLGLLGLIHDKASAAGIESVGEQLSAEQVNHITQLVRNMTGMPIPEPLHHGNGTGASNSTGHNTSTTDSSTTASPHPRRNKPDWQDHNDDEASEPVSLPLNVGPRSDMLFSEPQSADAAGLPADLPIAPPVSPPSALPVSPPVSAPVALPTPGASQGNNSSSTPAPPVPPPALPVGVPSPPSPPAGASPFPPPLPANPHNTPAQA